ncbi:hypothetical protein [Desulfitobacterium sp.]|uniref:hypothetical protein n=1 Tax=Desulfitobacterium sp. TaxID=49981 RepID=UPI002C7081A7|nr:hypothetical protein [Desulfitobacterium sp.]HVJ49276.1 hypothetical protein [Desulfitobacterium sp.]
MELSESFSFDEEHCSEKIQSLLKEVRLQLAPKSLVLRLSENLSMGSDAHTHEDEQGNCVIVVKPSAMNDVTLSHELLHLLVRPVVPQLVRVIKFDLVGIIGTELQGYLEHRWIRAEQERRGILTAEIEQELFPNLLGILGSDDQKLGDDIHRILVLNNLINTFPAILEKNRVDFARRNTRSLTWAERIMAHYPQQMLDRASEARSCIVGAIQEWAALFQECGLNPDLLRYLLSVVPVFNRMQLTAPTQTLLGLWPEAIRTEQTSEISSVLYTLEDGQGCALLTMKQKDRDLVFRYFHNTTLEDFLKLVPIPYLVE